MIVKKVKILKFEKERKKISALNFTSVPKLTDLVGGQLRNAATLAQGISFGAGNPADPMAQATQELSKVFTQGILDEPVEFYWEAALLRQQIMNAEQARGRLWHDKNTAYETTMKQLLTPTAAGMAAEQVAGNVQPPQNSLWVSGKCIFIQSCEKNI